MGTEDYKPRKAIDVTPRQLERLRELIPYGLHSLVFRAIIDDLILVLEECGPAILAPILERKTKLRDWSPTIRRGIDETGESKKINLEDGPT